MRRPPRKRAGYHIEILHKNPKGELKKTLMAWEAPQRSRKRIGEFVMRLESHFAFIRPDVGANIGYTPKPLEVNLRNNITGRVVAAWRRAA